MDLSTQPSKSVTIGITLDTTWRCPVCDAKPNPFCVRVKILSSGKIDREILGPFHRDELEAGAAAGEEGYTDLFDPPAPSAPISS